MVARRPHLLHANASTVRPRHVCFVDTESHQERRDDGSTWHTLRLGVACYWRCDDLGVKESEDWYDFNTPVQFATWLVSRLKKRTRIYLVTHNLSFDLAVLDFNRQMQALGFELTHFYLAGFTGIVRYRQENQTIFCMDNMNLFAVSLATLGEQIGVGKGRVDFAVATDQELAAYCRQDVTVMLEAWRRWYAFLDRYDLGVFAPTLAGQAFNAYRHRFMHYQIYIHADDRATELEREAYTGGRVEVFRAGTYSGQTFTKLDVNAMYPSVMRDGLYPCRLLGVRQKTSVKNLTYLVGKYAVIARVHIRVPVPVFPKHVNGWRAYPTGEFRTTLTTDELALALEEGWVLEVYEHAFYLKAPLFRDWVDWVWRTEQQAKAAGDKTLRWQCKLLRNSLYGKWGQRGLERECLGDTDHLLAEMEELYDSKLRAWVLLYNFAGKRWQDIAGEASFNAFVAIAAHVTAQARLKLWEVIKRAGRGHVYYCDTDSVIVDECGRAALDSLIDPGRLGYLKVEDESDRLSIWAAKDYQLGDHKAQKGVSRDAQVIGPASVIQDEWPSLLQSWRTSTPDTVRVRKVIKVLQRQIHSGVRQSDGCIIPFQVFEDSKGLTVLNDPASLPF
jgi:hypothetical protein